MRNFIITTAASTIHFANAAIRTVRASLGMSCHVVLHDPRNLVGPVSCDSTRRLEKRSYLEQKPAARDQWCHMLWGSWSPSGRCGGGSRLIG